MIGFRVDGLKVRMGAQTVLDVADLTIEGPGLVAIVGPNGAGKSTLLRAMAGLLKPTRGSVTVVQDGVAIGDSADRTAIERLGYVPDRPVMFEDMTVADNMWFVAWTAGQREMPGQALDLVNQLRFGPLLDRYPGQLSRGQKQMATLLVAAARSVDGLLLDEPTLALDQTNRGVLAGALAARASNSLVVVASHERDIISGATRSIRLERGSVVDNRER